MSASPRSFCLCLLTIVCCTATTRAASLTFDLTPPTADAFVSANNPTLNYGAAGALEVSGSASSTGAFESVLKFATSTAKSFFDTQFGAGNWSVTGISLELTSGTPNNALFNAQSSGTLAAVWMQNNTWPEGTGTPAGSSTSGITFANLPSFLGVNDQSLGAFFFNSSLSGGNGVSATYALTPSSGILTDIAAGNVTSMELAPADANVSYLFNSLWFGTTCARPVLIITAVPEPATLSLLGAGLLALGVIARARCSHRVKA